MEPLLGTVLPMAFAFAPIGWMSCEGQILAIQQNTALFALLGTNYGGNGTSTFALPDLRGRAIVGQGAMPGGSFYSVGEMGGYTNVTLTNNQMPMHTHAITVNANVFTSDNNDPTGNYFGGGGGNNFTTTAPDTQMNTGCMTEAAAGGNQPINILNPYLCTYYNIATQGIFPSRN
jgi:microcystin-dependent protein